MLPQQKVTIGRREWATLPDFGLLKLDVKVDTGAYTSSIHVDSCYEKDGKLHVIFLDDKHPAFNGKEIVFTQYRIKKVKSSNGESQERFFVKGNICIAALCFETEFSLTRRKGMRFPILLGRKLLNKRFVVDTSLKYMHQLISNTL